MDAGAGMGLGGMFTQIGMGLTNIGHSAIQNKRARDHQTNQWRRNLEWGPTHAVQGLKAAGLNPILAAQGALGGGGGGGGGGAGMIGGAMTGDPASSARTAMLMNQELKNKRFEGEILDQKRKQEWNTTKASDHWILEAKNRADLLGYQASVAAAQPGGLLYRGITGSSARAIAQPVMDSTKAWLQYMIDQRGKGSKKKPFVRKGKRK